MRRPRLASSPSSPVGETEGTVATMIYTSGTTGKPKGAYRKITDQSTAVFKRELRAPYWAGQARQVN